MENKASWRTKFHGEQSFMENKASWRTKLHGEQSFMENKVSWRTKLHGEQSFMANKASWRTKLHGQIFPKHPPQIAGLRATISQHSLHPWREIATIRKKEPNSKSETVKPHCFKYCNIPQTEGGQIHFNYVTVL